MAITKSYTREVHDAGRMDKIQTLDSTGTAVSNFGVTVFTSTAVGVYPMDAPIAGLRKALVLTADSTSIVVDGDGATFGAGSTAIDLQGTQGADLIGLSTAAWGVIATSGTLS
jgi:hypothetical protein